jgi:hypothetical protein
MRLPGLDPDEHIADPGRVTPNTKKTNRDIVKQHLVRALRANQKLKIIDPV